MRFSLGVRSRCGLRRNSRCFCPRSFGWFIYALSFLSTPVSLFASPACPSGCDPSRDAGTITGLWAEGGILRAPIAMALRTSLVAVCLAISPALAHGIGLVPLPATQVDVAVIPTMVFGNRRHPMPFAPLLRSATVGGVVASFRYEPPLH